MLELSLAALLCILVALAFDFVNGFLGLTVAATGRLGRTLGRRATLAPTAAAVAGLAAVLADLTLLVIVTGQALTAPAAWAWAPVLVAVGASLTRGTRAGRAARRCLATRAALT
jgi:hypothetical protein